MTVGDNDHGDADPIRFLIERLRSNTYTSTDPQEAANLLEEMVDAIDDRDELMKANEKLQEERDEARRDICCQTLPPEYKDWKPNEVDYTLRLIASQHGWDCFKEGNNV